jgi:hypothetical protein
MPVLKFLSLVAAIIVTTSIQAQEDNMPVLYSKDSAITPETEPTVLFFQQHEKLPGTILAKTILVDKRGKIKKLATLIKPAEEGVNYADYVLADMDNDGKKELVTSDFTGGAHCCDEIVIYKNVGPNKYQQAGRMFAGHTVINADKTFSYNLHEHLGYFFTCYACALTDTSDAAPVDVSVLNLKYSKGKLSIIPGDTELKSTILDNLGKLGEMPFSKPDEAGMDEGWRKAFALNLATYYFSFGKNLVETQKLFNKYYKFPDNKKVWAALAKQFQYIRWQSDF